jgi:hypothetical protein
VVEFIISISACFGRHTTHHQGIKNCNCSLWFYISLWLPAAAMAEPAQLPATINVFLVDSSPLCVYNNLGYLVMFQSKHSCFWCFLKSGGIGQHVSTPFYCWVIIRSLLFFLVCGNFSTFCNATYSSCLFFTCG